MNSSPITIVIPCLNEVDTIERTIGCAIEQSALEVGPPSIVVVDGGSKDETQAAIHRSISAYPAVSIIRKQCERASRGEQLHLGAASSPSSSSLLLFLHADTLLPQGWDRAIVDATSHRSSSFPIVGCFKLSLAIPRSSMTLSLRIMLAVANMRATYAHLPYGDQAYFVRKREFEVVGGFANLPLMEDVDLLRRYERHLCRMQRRKIGRCPPFSFRRRGPSTCVHVVPLSVSTSARRWVKKGVCWNTIMNQFYMAAWYAGASPHRIYRWYYGIDARSKGTTG